MKSYYGYIEGYYGKMLSWEERTFLINQFPSLNLNTYLYAPKEDPFHRYAWRTPYTKSWLQDFSIFVKCAQKNKTSVIPAMAPGLSFDYTSKSDYQTLLKKFSTWCEGGITELALLMDDIPVMLPQASKKTFSSLGHAHAALLEKLTLDISRRFPKTSMIFCPTVYSDQMAETKDAKTSQYLQDLATSIPAHIPLFWTGQKIVSPTITKSSIDFVLKTFHNNIIIWDNLYANDYCPQKLFLSPLTGRNPSMLKNIRGFMINPTGLLHTDLFYLRMLNGYISKNNPLKGWQQSAAQSGFPKEIKNIIPLLGTFNSVPLKHLTLSGATISGLRKALFTLLWTWKSPLHQEWYPFLHALDTDLALLDPKNPVTPQWIAKKIPTLHASLLRNPA